jgi:hypothetical protein
MVLAIGLSYIVFIMLMCILFIPSSPGLLSWKWVTVCLRLFLNQLRWPCDFCPRFCLYAVLHLLICVSRSILVFLEWNQLDYGVWSFWCVVKLGLQVFGEFLLLCLLKWLLYNSLFFGVSCFGVNEILTS